MKKKTARSSAPKKGSQAKSAGAPNSVDDYIAGIPESSRKPFEQLRAAVRQAAPKDAIEVLSYGILALKTERVLVWYAAFSKHCSLFPSASVLVRFKDELNGLTVSKGTVQFPLDKPLPIALVKKLVRARVAEAAAKGK
jgi:uncharacterized protein YdhG (YjbR/CyaY superfamily)